MTENKVTEQLWHLRCHRCSRAHFLVACLFSMVSFLWQQAVTWGVSQHWKDFRMSDKTCSWHLNCQYHWISIDQWYQGAPIDFPEIKWPAVYNLLCEAPTITRFGSPSCGLVKLSLVRSHLSLQKGAAFLPVLRSDLIDCLDTPQTYSMPVQEWREGNA